VDREPRPKETAELIVSLVNLVTAQAVERFDNKVGDPAPL